jgi:hypothetical protein
MGQEIESRKRQGKETDLYVDGKLIPKKRVQKEVFRQGYMTTAEKLSQTHGPYTRASRRWFAR